MTSPLLDHFHEQAVACERYGSPFTARLVEKLAQDLAAGGPVADLVGDWPGHPRADAVALRMAGALHAIALSGRDTALTTLYPNVARTWAIEPVWERARELLVSERDWIARFVEQPPQTNEVNRSIALLAGFLTCAQTLDRPLEMLELGASAGLNLHWDCFAYRTKDWSWNPQGEVPIATDWRGPAPPVDVQPIVRARAACDQSPLDIADPDQRQRLRAYIWPDQPERLARFDAAARVAIARGARVDRADAATWIAEKLAARPDDAAVVVYHSVFLQYPPRSTRRAIRAAIASAGARATRDAPLAWLRFEPEAILGGPPQSERFLVDLITWPGGERRVLLETSGHAHWIESRRL